MMNETCLLELVMVSKAADGASFGTWNLTMPNLSEAVYDNILGHVVSLNT